MASSPLTVSFLNATGEWLVSRHFSTLRAARNWAAIYRGGQGGERLA